MKSRMGFVSNSSSSSFICPVCQKSCWGMDDCSYEEMGFICCENGHYRCTACQKEHEKCPICSLKIVEDWNVISYLLKTCGKTQEEIKNEIRSRFKSYNEMCDFLGEKRKLEPQIIDIGY